MFIDITVEFKALVKDLTSRSEELGLVIPVKEKTRILGSGDSLPRQAEIIVKTVTSLSELLQQNKDAYYWIGLILPYKAEIPNRFFLCVIDFIANFFDITKNQ